jgi:uncharacterized protein
VNDHAGVLDDSSRARLESFLDQVKRKTGVQFAVLVVKTTAPLDPISYKTEAYRRWFQGHRNSLLLVVALDERRVAFETGYELEGILPDGLEARIIRREMTPRFRAGDYAGGIRAAVLQTSAIIAKDRGVTLEWDGSELRYEDDGSRLPLDVVLKLALLVAAVIIGILARMRPGHGRGRRHRDWWSAGSGWGGWGGWGGSGGEWGGGGGGGGGFGGFGGGGGFGSGGGGGSGGW